MQSQKDLLLIEYSIKDSLVYLSHLETMSMFQRALVRAEVDMVYSEGFNPRPRISVFFPRSTGLGGDSELLGVRVYGENTPSDIADVQERIQSELPLGLKICGISTGRSKALPKPFELTYRFCLRSGFCQEDLSARVDKLRSLLKASEKLVIVREKGPGKSPVQFDVKPFIIDVGFKDEAKVIEVKCKIVSGSTVRWDELMNLLEISVDDLSRPAARENILYN
jgi:radical SAM-linked protein